jgi:hypothetical protein
LEVIYLILQQLSINVIFVAAAFTSANGYMRSTMVITAIVLSVCYVTLTIWAAFKPQKRFLTFEWMSWVSLFPVLWMFFLHIWQGFKTASDIEWSYAGIWAGLFASIFAYGLYIKLGITEWLWRRKFWFSENDVLHVTLIIWMLYLYWLIPMER